MTLESAFKRPDLEDWIQRISVEEMPVMYRTALDIATLASNDGAPNAQLVNAILKDPCLTARVLTLANSAFHNPGAHPLNTVSRAVVVLGFNCVRSICVTVTLVDSLLQGQAREELLRELARSFHAAVVARGIAVQRKDESPEEVFIAALLYHVGELSFWCFGGGLRDTLERAMDRDPRPADVLETEIVGFPLRDLTAGLAAKWKLGPVLEQVVRGYVPYGSRAHCVQLSRGYVSALHRGKDHPDVPRLELEIGKLLSIPMQAAKKLLESCGKEAAETARLSGANSAASRIARLFIEEAPKGASHAEKSESEDESPFAEFDPLLQLKALREFTALLSTTSDVDEALESLLEGMYRSIGLDRAVFAVVNGDRTRLVAKFAIGHEIDELRERFDLPLDEAEPHIFYTALERKAVLWAKVGNPAGSPGFIQRRIKQLVGPGPFFVAPAIVNGKSIGLFYSDRRISDRPLDDESFQSFKHFVQQANLGLEFLAKTTDGGKKPR